MKDRHTGRANGNTMYLKYDQESGQESGQLFETDFPEGLNDKPGKGAWTPTQPGGDPLDGADYFPF